MQSLVRVLNSAHAQPGPGYPSVLGQSGEDAVASGKHDDDDLGLRSLGRVDGKSHFAPIKLVPYVTYRNN